MRSATPIPLEAWVRQATREAFAAREVIAEADNRTDTTCARYRVEAKFSRCALGFLQLEPRAPELRLLHRWLDNWRGVGALAGGLHQVGYDLSLIQQADVGWNATFFVTGRIHSIAGGWANAPTPWRTVQRAGWDAIQHAERFF